jgi:hypothetical protein
LIWVLKSAWSWSKRALRLEDRDQPRAGVPQGDADRLIGRIRREGVEALEELVRVSLSPMPGGSVTVACRRVRADCSAWNRPSVWASAITEKSR